MPYTGDVVGSEGENYVTDGSFLFRSGDMLKRLWSSFSSAGSAIGIAESVSGKISGPWIQQDSPKFDFGGHGMLLDVFDGRRYLALHAPNTAGIERLRLVPWENE